MTTKTIDHLSKWQARISGAKARAESRGKSPRIAAARLAPTGLAFDSPELKAYRQALNLTFSEDARLTEKRAQKDSEDQ